MSGFSPTNLYFEPYFPIFFILLISICFFILILFSLINKSAGIFLRLSLFILLIFIILQPGYRIEKMKNENDIVTFVIDKTKSQKISKRTEEIDRVFQKMLSELTKYKDIDILEIIIDNNKVTKRYGSLQEIINNSVREEVINKMTNSTEIINNLENNINEYPSQRISSDFILPD